MRIEGCEFPDDCLYDSEGLVWVREVSKGQFVIGITSLHAAVGGRLTHLRVKPFGVEYRRGRTIGTIESGRYFGPIRTPVTGVLLAANETLFRRLKTLSEAPYREGWFARLLATRWAEDRTHLTTARAASEMLRTQIAALRVRCFAAFPDYEMIEIGTECAAVLVRLEELIQRIEVGEVVHLVSDDSTAAIEMARWSEETGQPVVDTRQEGNLFHFLVKKIS